MKVSPEDAGKRLDIFVTEKLGELNRSIVKKLIDQSSILVNNQPQKSGYRLKFGDVVQIDASSTEKIVIPEIDLKIVYEDRDCIVIDKPIGVLAHSKGSFNNEATVASFILPKLSDIPDSNRAGIVHRLDRATSGVMICAKNVESQKWLQKQFSQRKVKKTYYAICNGHPKIEFAIIDMPIERNPKKPQTFRVGPNGKIAKTTYKVIKNNDKYSLIELTPETGRTHQLRVHLEHIKCPIVGDILYGGESAERLFLHANKLEVTLPNRQRVVFESKLPKQFMDMVS
jgi:23S rRNA pseudouridine1911/1915/1917 synthase